MANNKPGEKSNQPLLFVPTDFLDPASVVSKLQNDNDPLSRHFASRFRPEILKLVREHDTSKPVKKQLIKALTEEFIRIATGPLFYDAKAFNQVEVNEDSRRLLESKPEGDLLARLNTMLIEDAFPTELLRNYTKWPKVRAERVQTGVRIEKRLLKVLKGMAEYEDMNLGELFEEIFLHALDGVSTFDSPASQEKVKALKSIYEMDYDAHAAGRFVEA